MTLAAASARPASEGRFSNHRAQPIPKDSARCETEPPYYWAAGVLERERSSPHKGAQDSAGDVDDEFAHTLVCDISWGTKVGLKLRGKIEGKRRHEAQAVFIPTTYRHLACAVETRDLGGPSRTSATQSNRQLAVSVLYVLGP